MDTSQQKAVDIALNSYTVAQICTNHMHIKFSQLIQFASTLVRLNK